MHKHTAFFSILIILAATIQGCLPDEPPIPKRISLRFNVENVNTEIARGGDAITVNDVMLVLDKFNLLIEGEGVLETRIDILVMRYQEQDGDDEVVIESNLGYSEVSGFSGIHFFFDTPKEGDAINNPTLKEGSETFSVIMEGTYNGEEFLYRSQMTYDQLFEFDSVQELDADTETLKIVLKSDLEQWIVNDQTDMILDPTDSENSAVIHEQIQQSLSIEASTYQSIPYN